MIRQDLFHQLHNSLPTHVVFPLFSEWALAQAGARSSLKVQDKSITLACQRESWPDPLESRAFFHYEIAAPNSPPLWPFTTTRPPCVFCRPVHDKAQRSRPMPTKFRMAKVQSLLSLTLSEVQTRPKAQTKLRLHPIQDQEQWQYYTKMRTEIESAYGLPPTQVTQIVSGMQRKQQHLMLTWYLADSAPLTKGARQNATIGMTQPPPTTETFCGAIGCAHWEVDGVSFARLQDVDIAPAFRGRGLGRHLLDAICEQVSQQGCVQLFVKADLDDWPIHWYRRYGFQDRCFLYREV